MYALLTAIALLFPPPDLSNHWRWASASVNQSSSSPTPIPTPNPQPNPPTPIPSPVPSPSPSPYKIGDKCPNCDKGWLTTDSVVREKCWKCAGDGIINAGDPILTGSVEGQSKNDKEEGDKKTTDETAKPSNGTGKKGTSKSDSVKETSESKINPNLKGDGTETEETCYKPTYSDDGFWIWDVEGKKWVRSAKQPQVYKQVQTGHWETKPYTVCLGRKGCKTYYKQVWVADSPKRVLQDAPPKAASYPIRGSWWTGCGSYRHLLTGPHAGKFDEAWLNRLSYEELQSLHSDHHEEMRYGRSKVKWSYVNK